MAVPIVDSANRSWPTNDVSDCGRVLRSGSARLVDITVQGHRLALKGSVVAAPLLTPDVFAPAEKEIVNQPSGFRPAVHTRQAHTAAYQSTI